MNTTTPRPPGLIVVVVIAAAYSALGLFTFGLILVLVAADEPSLLEMSADKQSIGGVMLVFAFFLISIAGAVACLGLWQRDGWAISLARWICGLSTLLGVVFVFRASSPSAFIAHVFLICTYIWILYYLSKKAFREYYSGMTFSISQRTSKDSDSVLQPRDQFFC